MLENTNGQAVAAEEWDGSAGAGNPTTAIESATANPLLFREFSGAGARSDVQNDISLVLDIPVQLNVELGRTKITIKNLLQLTQGTVVELDGQAGGPMKVLVNGCLIAHGEVVVVDEKFGIRLTEIVAPSERIDKINK
jgi:flagellar motor switch protein FliN/FliY